MLNEVFEKTREKLNNVGCGFCLAKWTQVTMHLHNGMTHSCHHPTTHKIPLTEIANDPKALHNTNFKKRVSPIEHTNHPNPGLLLILRM